MKEPLFTAWLQEVVPTPVPTIRIFKELPASRPVLLPRIGLLLVEHYVGVETVLRMGGYKNAAALVRTSLPESKQTRSGDLGEILASEYVNSQTSFRVPFPKLRWKSDRQMPMHGNDIVAIDSGGSTVRVLKGECKSKASLSKTELTEAVGSLDKHGGRPNPSTVGFIIKRLYELGRDAEAKAFEGLLCASAVRPSQITHQVFALAGNDPTRALSELPQPRRRGISRLAAAVVVTDHPRFVSSAFKAAHGAGS